MDETDVNLGNGVPFWSKDLVIPLLTSLKLAPGTAEYAQLMNAPSSSYTEDHNPSGIPLFQPSYPSADKALKCSHCDVVFGTREDQVAHYSLDWHRFNLKQSIQGGNCVSQEHFLSCKYQEPKEESDDDDSGGEEDNEESSDEEEVTIKRKPRIFLLNADNEVISIYRTVIQHKKTEFSSEVELLHRVCAAPRKLYWVIILAGGGHFAAAVFNGEEVLAHKTFHSYTVRAKQGGSQSSRDNKNATSHPRSAGASLRRYNEQAHNQHVHDLMTKEWNDHIATCDLIFCRCPKSNLQLLFGGSSPILSKTDFRLRTIPFPSKKPTLAQVKKVHKNLSQIYIHGTLEDMTEKEKCCPKKSLSCASPTKSISSKRGERGPKKLTKDEMSGMDTHDMSLMGQSSSEDEVKGVTESLQLMNNTWLDPYGSSTQEKGNWKRKKHKKKTTKTDKESEQDKIVNPNGCKESSSESRKIENFVYTACRTGNLLHLKAIHQLARDRDFTDIPECIPNDVTEAILATDTDFDLFALKFGMLEKSLLHVTAENAHKNVIWWLLDHGCDPCVKNCRNETPYVATKTKEAKNHFRRYMVLHPSKYDYQKANIPGPLTKEEEAQQKMKLEEKKKQQKKNKLNKEKEKKKEEERKKKAEEEKEMFLNLSDREKRAMAAEKRMLAAAKSAIVRCFQCAEDMGTTLPFEYSDFKFCSTSCVREHRTKNKPL